MQDRFTRKIQKLTRKFFENHTDVKLITVVGTIGKTSAEIAIATMLSSKYKVWVDPKHPENHLEVCMQLLGIKMPAKFGFWEKRSIIRAAKQRIKQPTGANVLIQELPVWSQEDLDIYKSYLFPDVTVLSGISKTTHETNWTDEDMGRIYLGLTTNSRKVFLNHDDIDGRFAAYLENGSVSTYGTNNGAEYLIANLHNNDLEYYTGDFFSPYSPDGVDVQLNVSGMHSVRPCVAAAAVSLDFGLSIEEVVKGLTEIQPQPGRMRRLDGVKNSVIIDDTMSTSAKTAVSAIQTVQEFQASERIIVCGGIGVLGVSNQEEYLNIVNSVDPIKTDWLILVGPDAVNFMGARAREKGVRTREFTNAIDAGIFIHSIVDDSSIVLYSGSEDGVFLEEAIKIVLHSSSDIHKLARQDPHSLEMKRSAFSRF